MAKRNLTVAEQEIVVRRSADEDVWDVYCCIPHIARKLQKIATQIGVPGEKVDDYGYRFTLPLNAVSFRAPRKATAAQREHLARMRAKTKEASGR